MAKYGRSASKTVASAMRRRKKGTLKSGSGGRVKSRKQAIAIGLSEAREKGAKVPRKSSRKRSSLRKGSSKKRQISIHFLLTTNLVGYMLAGENETESHLRRCLALTRFTSVQTERPAGCGNTRRAYRTWSRQTHQRSRV